MLFRSSTIALIALAVASTTNVSAAGDGNTRGQQRKLNPPPSEDCVGEWGPCPNGTDDCCEGEGLTCYGDNNWSSCKKTPDHGQTEYHPQPLPACTFRRCDSDRPYHPSKCDCEHTKCYGNEYSAVCLPPFLAHGKDEFTGHPDQLSCTGMGCSSSDDCESYCGLTPLCIGTSKDNASCQPPGTHGKVWDESENVCAMKSCTSDRPGHPSVCEESHSCMGYKCYGTQYNAVCQLEDLHRTDHFTGSPDQLTPTIDPKCFSECSSDRPGHPSKCEVDPTGDGSCPHRKCYGNENSAVCLPDFLGVGKVHFTGAPHQLSCPSKSCTTNYECSSECGLTPRCVGHGICAPEDDHRDDYEATPTGCGMTGSKCIVNEGTTHYAIYDSLCCDGLQCIPNPPSNGVVWWAGCGTPTTH